MEKIISLFMRNYETDRLVRDEIVPGAEWVVAGEGTATEKIDGTSCLFQDGKLYKRYDAKKGKKPPENFTPAQPEADSVTGHWPGWVPVGEGPEDKWHREALETARQGPTYLRNWTYELIGPKVQGNPYRRMHHELIRHGEARLELGRGLSFNVVREFLSEHDIEGIVWWRHIDDLHCDKVKIKRRDFGLQWPVR